MININKYNSIEAYNVDNNRPADECCLSLVDNSLVFEGKNVLKTEGQLSEKEVCLIAKDLVTGTIVYIPVHTFDPTSFDSTRYQLKDYVRFGECMGKQLKIHKSQGGGTWAISNRYKLICDTTASGGFHWAITINGSEKAGDVSWAASDTLASIAAQINAVANIASVVAGDDFIRITVNSYSNSTFTLTDNTGGTLVDLSLYVKINGVAQAETHRTFQAQSVATLFPDLGYLAANSVQYAKNGYNLSYMCGCEIGKYKAYYRENGATTWTAENALGRMNEATFNKCADGTIGGADGIALYNKYNGSWDAYMEAAMVKIDDLHKDGVEYKNYDNGADQNERLCSVTTLDFDGSYVPAYTAAAIAASDLYADADLGGKAHLPTNHELALMFEEGTYSDIRLAQSFLTGATQLSNAGYYWCVTEYYGLIAWLFNGYSGRLNNSYEGDSNSVRPVLA